jgi:hypothetical protein
MDRICKCDGPHKATCPVIAPTIDATAAAAALRAGEKIRVTTGDGPNDPVLIAWRDGGIVQSRAVAGWSEGVEEPVCGIESAYLTEHFFAGRALELVEAVT